MPDAALAQPRAGTPAFMETLLPGQAFTVNIGIGTPGPWSTAELVAPSALPDLTAGTARPLLPSAIEWRYWTVTLAVDGGTSITQTYRLLLSYQATVPGASIPVTATGSVKTWVQIVDTVEVEIVPAGRLLIGP